MRNLKYEICGYDITKINEIIAEVNSKRSYITKYFWKCLINLAYLKPLTLIFDKFTKIKNGVDIIIKNILYLGVDFT